MESRLQEALRGRPLADEWTLDRELMAQLVELVSVTASARHRLRKPIEVKRPRHVTEASYLKPATMGEAARITVAMAHSMRGAG